MLELINFSNQSEDLVSAIAKIVSSLEESEALKEKALSIYRHSEPLAAWLKETLPPFLIFSIANLEKKSCLFQIIEVFNRD